MWIEIIFFVFKPESRSDCESLHLFFAVEAELESGTDHDLIYNLNLDLYLNLTLNLNLIVLNLSFHETWGTSLTGKSKLSR